MAHAGRVDLTEAQTRRLEEMARSLTLAARKVLRAKIVLRRAKGESFRSIGQALDCDHRTAWQWVKIAKVARARKALDATHGADVTK